MTRKDNFNKAVFDMFGVGSDPTAEQKEKATKAEPVKADSVKTEPVKAEPVKAEPIKTEPVKPVTANTGSFKEAPVIKAEPKKEEPKKEEPVAEEALVTSSSAAPANYVPSSSAQSYVLMPATYIAPGTLIEGSITSKSDMEIAGKVKGNITTDGDVTLRDDISGNVVANNLYLYDCKVDGDAHCTGRMQISEHSKIKGNVFVKELQCSGAIVGDVDVEEFSSLGATAVIEGSVYTDSMSMERGAVLKGNLTMGARPEKKAAPIKR